jgi:hypothetical protein
MYGLPTSSRVIYVFLICCFYKLTLTHPKSRNFFQLVTHIADNKLIVPCEQQVLIELAINSGDFFGDFYVMFQRENHFINKRLQKPRRLNLKCIPGVNIVNKTNRNRYNSVLKILCKIFFCQL